MKELRTEQGRWIRSQREKRTKRVRGSEETGQGGNPTQEAGFCAAGRCLRYERSRGAKFRAAGRAWGRRGGREGEADPKDTVSGTGYSKANRRAGRQGLGARGRPGEGARSWDEGTQGPVCSPVGPRNKATTPAARREERD